MSKRWGAWSLVSVAIWLGAVHCGEDSPAGPSPGPDASAGDSAASEDGGGSDGGVAAEAGDAEPPLHRCGPQDSSRTNGTLDGAPFDESWEIQSVARTEGDPWFITDALKSRGHEFFRGVGPGNAESFAPGEHPFDIGLLHAPTSSKVAGSTFCLGGGVAERDETEGVLSLRTRAAKWLGQCPAGTPVAGEVKVCSLTCDPLVEGELEGVTIDATGFRLSGDLTDLPVFGVDGRGDHLFLKGWSDDSGSETRPLTGIFATLPKDGAPGAVFCMGEGSEYLTNASGTFVVLKNVTKLGDCGPGAGGSDRLVLCR